MNATGHAHAKLILMGEHFVVPFSDHSGRKHPGSAALALPLPELQTEVQLSSHEELLCEIDPSARELGFGDDAPALMAEAVRFAAKRFAWDLDKSPVRAYSKSNFPCSRGLGSSASFSVALSRAFTQLASHSQTDLREDAQSIENLFHGKSSGLDTSTILSEDPILYRDGKILGTFSPVAVDIVVVDSGPRAASSTLVSKTMELRRKRPDRWLALSAQVNELVQACLAAIERESGTADVAHAIQDSQVVLSEIGLMTTQLAEILLVGEKSGALAGKMSGAGSGGIAFFVAHPGDGKSLARKMAAAGVRIISTVDAPLGGELR